MTNTNTEHTDDNQKFIVAEITKNWTNETPAQDLLSQRFEAVINIACNRGYKLIDWKFTTLQNDELLTETIIAIFERIAEYNPQK